MTKELNPQNYFRLPWSLTDNGISWLEVTTKCNLACKGCYRDPHSGGHKTLEQIAEELAVFKKLRNSDCMSVAGGDPLVHPQIVQITKMIKDGGWKPIINTNGLALTPDLLYRLKKAGVFGFTFHIDTSQTRHDADATNETELNKLRHRFAEMLANVGGIACSFNQTVNEETLKDIPEVIQWASKYPEIVHTLVFILYRQPYMLGDYDYYANGKKLKLDVYADKQWGGNKTLKAPDIVAKIREVLPGYEPAAYLNGTADPDSFKWLIGLRAAVGSRTFGYISPRFMEIVQHGSHALRKKWLSYSSPAFMSMAKLTSLVFAPFDSGMRRIAANYLKTAFKKPSLLFKKMHLQTYTIIQPVDIMENGAMNMCDGCPDITVHNGKLYWSCRLEEIKKYGAFIQTVPRGTTAPESASSSVEQ
jgi:pyruvate-formate lyase-activating enzyme